MTIIDYSKQKWNIYEKYTRTSNILGHETSLKKFKENEIVLKYSEF